MGIMISCEIPNHLYTINHSVAVYMTRMGGYHNFYDVVLNEDLKLWLETKGGYKIMQVTKPNPVTERFERSASIVFDNEDTAMEFKLFWL
jgi:uncharacterized membrane protein